MDETGGRQPAGLEAARKLVKEIRYRYSMGEADVEWMVQAIAAHTEAAVKERDAWWVARLTATGFHPGLSVEENVADLTARLASAEEDLHVSREISGTFWEALKLLNLTHLNVANPGSHVANVIRERDALKAAVEQAQRVVAAAIAFVNAPIGEDDGYDELEAAVVALTPAPERGRE